MARGSWILLATILGSGLVFVDGTIVNVALPAMQADLGASLLELQWVVEAYALALASLLLTAGALSDRLGRRRIFVIGTVIFGVSSLACGLAPTAALLVGARAVQGVGAALLAPTSLAILGACFEGEARGRAIGTWSGAGAIMGALGPLLGGFLVDHASWRWAFLINPVLAVGVIAIALTQVPESRDEEVPAALDVPGAALGTIALAALTVALVTAGAEGFRGVVVLGGLSVAAAASVAFVIVEVRREDPMVPPGIFRSSTFAGANLLTLLLYGALAGMFFFVPLNLMQVQGYSPTAAGAALLPLVATIGLLSRTSGTLSARLGPRPQLTAGPLIAAAGYALYALPGVGGSYASTFLLPTLLVGLGMAAAVAPLTTAVMSALESRHAGLASGVNNAVSRVAAVLAVAVFGAVALQVFAPALEGSLRAIAAPEETTAAVLAQVDRLAGIAVPPGPAQAPLEDAVRHAFVTAFRWIAMIAAGLAAAGVVGFATIRRDAPQRAGE